MQLTLGLVLVNVSLTRNPERGRGVVIILINLSKVGYIVIPVEKTPTKHRNFLD